MKINKIGIMDIWKETNTLNIILLCKKIKQGK